MKTLFIVGAQRSGTTLLSVMLEQHPEILMEKNAVSFRLISVFNNAAEILPHNLQVDRNDFYHWLIKNDYKGRLASLLDLDNLASYDSMKGLIAGSIKRKLEAEQKTYWADKAPNLQLYIPELLLLIPEAKIVHIIRDGRANAFSIAQRSYQHLQWSAQHWVEMNIPGLINQDLLGKDRYHLLKYEDLLLEPEATLSQLCTFLDLPYSGEMLQWNRGALAEEKRYVKSSLDTGKIDRYLSQLTAQNLRQVERIQGPLLKKLGYSLHSQPQPEFQALSLWRKIYYHQLSNFKLLFRSRQKGMQNRKNVEIKLPFRNRAYTFLLKLGQDLLARPIVRTIFRRTFYKEQHFRKED